MGARRRVVDRLVAANQGPDHDYFFQRIVGYGHCQRRDIYIFVVDGASEHDADGAHCVAKIGAHEIDCI